MASTVDPIGVVLPTIPDGTFTETEVDTLDHREIHNAVHAYLNALRTTILGIETAAAGAELGKVRLTDGATLGLNDVFARPNKLRNPRFDLWTAGTSFSADGVTADDWRAFKGTGGSPTMTVSRQAHALGDISGEPQYFYRHAQTAQATTTAPYLEQRLDDVRQEAGQYVTVSGWVKCGTGTVVVTPRASQYFGTGGSPSSTVDTDGSTITATTSWARFVRRIQVPSVSGKTIGSNADSYIAAQLRGPLSSTWTLDFSQVKVERGQAATEFEQLDVRLRRLLSGGLLNADIAAAADIALSKLAARHRVLAYKSSGTQALTATVEAVVTLDAEAYDTSTMHDPGSNHLITIPETGNYIVKQKATLSAAGSAANTLLAHIGLNGTGTRINTAAINCSAQYLSDSFPYYFTAGDTIQMIAWTDAAGSSIVNGQGYTNLNVVFLGR